MNTEIVPIVPDQKAKGNTETLASKEDKKKQISACKRWTFTLNNYTEEEHSKLIMIFSTDNAKYIIGKECGDKGTPHLQGYVEFLERVRAKSYIGNKRIHWEVARAARCINVLYCSKEGNYEGNLKPVRKLDIIEICNFYPWQTSIYTILNALPDDRTIHWVYETAGNAGKSAFVKHMVARNDSICVEGKARDIYQGMVQYYNRMGEYPQIVLVDVPREGLNYINYTALEKIKNGLLFSGKYESQQCVFNAPHIVIFANEEPEVFKLSADRWRVWNIFNKELIDAYAR